MIDLDRFRKRVPAGTRVKGIKFVYFTAWPSDVRAFGIFDEEGTLVRHGRELENQSIISIDLNSKSSDITTGWQDIALVQFFNQQILREVDFDALIYLIDGQWLTFEEIMS